MKSLPTIEHLSHLAAILTAPGKRTEEAVDQALEIWAQCRQRLDLRQESDELEQLAAKADKDGVPVKGSPVQPLGLSILEAMGKTGLKTERGFWNAYNAARKASGKPPRQIPPAGIPDIFFQEIITQEDIDLINASKRKKDTQRKRTSRNRSTPYQEKSSRDRRAGRTGQKPRRKK
jgi:hypothetical protein